ncbi:MAPEG family protein [Ruegeria faecimaris]|uniref:MAPEG family protein n=1 Tax=Ruegeria faecimaris TaxID=686389 RepID=UPI0023302DC7|nr:MAPEG family protein [Ruegeria faecimaris]
MEHTPQIALLVTAIFVLMSIPMGILVGIRRSQTGVLLLHGDDDELLRRIRAHGNFTEYVPLALLALAGAEIAGASDWLVGGCGLVLLVARDVHYVSLRSTPDGKGRVIGAALTTLVMLVLSLSILWQLAGSV